MQINFTYTIDDRGEVWLNVNAEILADITPGCSDTVVEIHSVALSGYLFGQAEMPIRLSDIPRNIVLDIAETCRTKLNTKLECQTAPCAG